MSKHVSISPNEAADRLAIHELVEAYAHCFGCYFRTRSFALTTWAGQWWRLCFDKHRSAKAWYSKTEIYEPWSSRKCPCGIALSDSSHFDRDMRLIKR